MRRNASARPYEGHLLLAVSRVRLATNLSNQLAELARETDLPMPTARATAAGDAMRLRGIPCVGRGITGGMTGARPDGGLDRLDRERRLIFVLARDIDGTSPGTQPEEALLDKEATAERGTFPAGSEPPLAPPP